MNLILTLGLLFYHVVAPSQLNKGAFILRGSINAPDNEYVRLYFYNSHQQPVYDSVLTSHGKFVFTGKIDGPTLSNLSLNKSTRKGDNSLLIFLEPGLMTINIDINNLSESLLKGSLTQDKLTLLNYNKAKIRRKYQKQIDSLSSVKSDEKRYEIRNRLAPFFYETSRADIEFFDNNPNSYITAYLLTIDGRDMSLDSLKMYYRRLGKTIQYSKSGKDIQTAIENRENGSPGSKAFSFSGEDINGQHLSLSDYLGKYVLIDFWASWCIPCRKGNPHLRNLFLKYRLKGIEFITISSDDKTNTIAAWRQVVVKDSLSELKHILSTDTHFNLDIAKKYGVSYLPTKILIDKRGHILKRFISDDDKDLDKALENLLK